MKKVIKRIVGTFEVIQLDPHPPDSEIAYQFRIIDGGKDSYGMQGGAWYQFGRAKDDFLGHLEREIEKNNPDS